MAHSSVCLAFRLTGLICDSWSLQSRMRGHRVKLGLSYGFLLETCRRIAFIINFFLTPSCPSSSNCAPTWLAWHVCTEGQCRGRTGSSLCSVFFLSGLWQHSDSPLDTWEVCGKETQLICWIQMDMLGYESSDY